MPWAAFDPLNTALPVLGAVAAFTENRRREDGFSGSSDSLGAAMVVARSSKRRRLAGVLGLGGLVLAGGFLFAKRDLTRWRLHPELAAIQQRRDLPYLPGSTHPKHRLDVYRATGAQARPVVHFVHGGYWTSGDKDHHRWLTGLYGSVGQALARKNLVAVVQSYRLAPEVDATAMQRDVASALCWTKRNIARFGGDPTKIVLMGHSAGGHLVASLASSSREASTSGCAKPKVRGYIALSAIWDIAGMQRSQDDAFERTVVWPVFGRDTSRYRGYSPMHRIGEVAAPMLVAFGSRDEPYLMRQSRRAFEALRARSSRHRLVEVAAASHRDMVLGFGSESDALTQMVADFVAAVVVTAP